MTQALNAHVKITVLRQHARGILQLGVVRHTAAMVPDHDGPNRSSTLRAAGRCSSPRGAMLSGRMVLRTITRASGPTAVVVRAGLPDQREGWGNGVRDCPYSKDEPRALASWPRDG